MTLKIDSTDELSRHHKIFSKLIYKCLKFDQTKRITSNELLKYQDHLELLEFNVTVSQLHFKLLLRQIQLEDGLLQRVLKD